MSPYAFPGMKKKKKKLKKNIYAGLVFLAIPRLGEK